MLEEHLNLYRSLNQNKVKYMVMGGVACGIYGSPRVTVDLDIAVEPTLGNIKKLYNALTDAEFGTIHLTTPEEILANEINIFEDYIKLDILIKPKGIDFNQAWKHRKIKNIKGVKVKFISLDDLIKSKISSKRAIDVEDVKVLKRLRRGKK